MKRLLALLFLSGLLNSVLADGVVIPPTAFPSEITMPDQRALIQFANGTERLVIETRFTGAGTNFVWVVPVPAEPKIEEATTGIFPTLEFLLRPKLIHDRVALFPALTVILILAYVLVLLKSDADPNYLALPLIAAIALAFYSGLPAVFAFIVIGWAFHRLSGGQTSVITLFFLILFVAVLSGMLLPALGGRGSAASFDDVSQTAHGKIGAFDVTTVASKNPEALFDWLRANGFEAPAGSKAVVEDYVKRGWVFSVAKLHRDASATATNSIHPLCFTFKTPTPIYPMRLTGLGTDALKVDLYVVSSERAAANHFKVMQCAPIVAKPNSTFRFQANELPLGHPLFKEWLHDSSVVTKLSANLDRAAMGQDVQIDWEPFVPYRRTIYSRQGDLTVAADWAVGSVLLGFCFGIVTFSWRRRTPSPSKALIVLLSLGSIVFLLAFLLLPIVPVRITKRFAVIRALQSAKYIGKMVGNEWEKAKPENIAEARRIADAAVANMSENENLLLGGLIHEEDSPGNYLIRQSTNGFEYVWFGTDGSENPVQ